MSIDRISTPSSLIETMRAMARDRAKGVGRGGKTTSADAPGDNDAAASKPVRQIEELRRRLHALAANVDIESAQSLADARAPALREILLWEFGSDFRKDSQFLPMVDAISGALDVDPGFQQRFVELIAGLQKGR